MSFKKLTLTHGVKLPGIFSAALISMLLVACGPENTAPVGDNNNTPVDTGNDNGEPDNGEPDNGEPDNGEPDNGEPDNGEPGDGEPDNGEPDDGEPGDGEPGDGEPGDGEPDSPISLSSPKNFAIKSGGIKTYQFTWTDSANAVYYKLLENIDGQSGFTVIRDNILQGQQSVLVEVPLHQTKFAQYMLQACVNTQCSGFSDIAFVQDNATELVKSVGFIKASNAQANDRFGGILHDDLSSSAAMSLSADGQTLVVGAPGEDSASITVGGVEDNNSRDSSGAVYVFVKTISGWQQQAYIKARNADAGDNFGLSVSVSADGNTLVVGAEDEDSNGQSVNPSDITEQNNGTGNSGAVYVFTRTGDQWSQHSYVKSSVSQGGDRFGHSVAMNGEGNRFVVGALAEDSSQTGVNSTAIHDGNADDSGAVFVFDLIDGTWVEQAFIKASNSNKGDRFGANVSISADGNFIAVGTRFEDSNATVINGDGSNNANSESGAVYVFGFDATQWSQQAYIKASNSQSGDGFGDAIGLNGNGDTLVVGARFEDSGNLNESDNSEGNSGAAYVFVRNGSSWTKQAYLKPSTIQKNDLFGRSISISANGQVIAVGANGDDSAGAFLSDNESNNARDNTGAVYVFERVADSWVQQSYVKASNPNNNDEFGRTVSLNEDGSTLAVGTDFDNIRATGINGDQVTGGAGESGVVYLF